jgi:hypothetical protein
MLESSSSIRPLLDFPEPVRLEGGRFGPRESRFPVEAGLFGTRAEGLGGGRTGRLLATDGSSFDIPDERRGGGSRGCRLVLTECVRLKSMDGGRTEDASETGDTGAALSVAGFLGLGGAPALLNVGEAGDDNV